MIGEKMPQERVAYPTCLRPRPWRPAWIRTKLVQDKGWENE